VLLGIRGDDFEVTTRIKFFATGLAQRNEGVAGAASGVDATERGADAGVFFDEGDAVIEVAAAEEDVIEHGGRFSGSP
jgi:hypothetical protein